MVVNNQEFEDPSTWGPHYWYVMRCVAKTYPKVPSQKDKTNVHNFFKNIKNLLPCDACSKHYSEALKKIPVRKSICCRSCLSKWVENIYNLIDEDIKKQIAEEKTKDIKEKIIQPIQSIQPNTDKNIKKQVKKKKQRSALSVAELNKKYANRRCKYCAQRFTST